jgi:hypothetical protein
MTTSEQVAWSMLAEMDEHDRRLVEAWQGLGCDLVESMLNSGVLRRGGRRVHPRDAETDAWLSRRRNPHSPRREGAEHEAAHAIVAEALGYRVVDIEVREDGNGETEYERASAEDGAAIACAAQIWLEELRFREYPGGAGGCSKDQRAVLARTDDFGAHRAAQTARRILRDRRDEVLRLADWLERLDPDEPLRAELVQAEIRQILREQD